MVKWEHATPPCRHHRPYLGCKDAVDSSKISSESHEVSLETSTAGGRGGRVHMGFSHPEAVALPHLMHGLALIVAPGDSLLDWDHTGAAKPILKRCFPFLCVG